MRCEDCEERGEEGSNVNGTATVKAVKDHEGN